MAWGFDSMKAIPSEGRSGGIVMLWKSDEIKVSIEEENRQFIHSICEFKGKPSFALTTTYAIPHSDLRSILWTRLKSLASSISCPWLVYGDLNDIMSSDERCGGCDAIIEG
ncbi:hypothetical protein K1719_010439 [Acacia pycnantha]|nr:hypothetical protein K1719_010439 [Acacia pycnantha]